MLAQSASDCEINSADRERGREREVVVYYPQSVCSDCRYYILKARQQNSIRCLGRTHHSIPCSTSRVPDHSFREDQVWKTSLHKPVRRAGWLPPPRDNTRQEPRHYTSRFGTDVLIRGLTQYEKKKENVSTWNGSTASYIRQTFSQERQGTLQNQNRLFQRWRGITYKFC